MICIECRKAGRAATMARELMRLPAKDATMMVTIARLTARAVERHAQCMDSLCPCHHQILIPRR